MRVVCGARREGGSERFRGARDAGCLWGTESCAVLRWLKYVQRHAQIRWGVELFVSKIFIFMPPHSATTRGVDNAYQYFTLRAPTFTCKPRDSLNGGNTMLVTARSAARALA